MIKSLKVVRDIIEWKNEKMFEFRAYLDIPKEANGNL